MPSVTDVDIANMALGILTEGAIDSLDENVKSARLINLHYDVVREAELMKNLWSFATIMPDDELEATDTGADGVFQYLYEAPADFLRPAWLTRDGMPAGVPITWSWWSDGIRTDFAGPLLMPYVANRNDPEEWDALFTQVFAAALAVKVALPLTAKASMLQAAKMEYDEALASARRVNAIMRLYRQTDTLWAYQRGDYRFARP